MMRFSEAAVTGRPDKERSLLMQRHIDPKSGKCTNGWATPPSKHLTGICWGMDSTATAE